MTESDWVAVGAAAGVVTALFTAAMAVAIIVTAAYAKQTLTATRSDSRARTRPSLVAYLERELLSDGVILLVLKNFGPSAAIDVDVTFEPPAPSAAEVAALPDSDMSKWLYQRFEGSVPVWAPGWSTSNVVRAGQGPLEPFAVVLAYVGPDGTAYRERFALHPEHILNETTSTPSKTTDPINLAQQGVAALQSLVRTMRSR